MANEVADTIAGDVKLDSEYYIAEYKREAMPDRTPFMYTIMSEKLTKAMDKIPDSGAAIISNYLKINSLTWAVQHMARDGNLLSVVLTNSELMKALKYEKQKALVDSLSNSIAYEVMRWYDIEHKPEDLIPIYGSGLEHIPDTFVDMIYDSFMSYDRYNCNYCIMLQPNIYDFCKDQKSYIRRMLTNIMRGKKVMFYDDKCSVIIIDKNDGKGPTVARAHALCCGVVFTLFGIINTTMAMKEYNERIR